MGMEQGQDLGLRLLAAAVAEGAGVATIEQLRTWNAEDGAPSEAIDAAYERGYARFDAARNVTSPPASA